MSSKNISERTKKAAVQEYQACGITMEELANKFNVSKKSISKWCKKYQTLNGGKILTSIPTLTEAPDGMITIKNAKKRGASNAKAKGDIEDIHFDIVKGEKIPIVGWIKTDSYMMPTLANGFVDYMFPPVDLNGNIPEQYKYQKGEIYC